MNISKQIQIIKTVQAKYPKMHIGGSIGLHLQGCDLKRDLSASDLDFCIGQAIDLDYSKGSNPGSGNDFIYATSISGIGVEIAIDVNAPFYNIDGIAVTAKDYIIRFKTEYAIKGYQKHIDDLKAMGIVVPVLDLVDDLPF